jgi:hypothetical protein
LSEYLEQCYVAVDFPTASGQQIAECPSEATDNALLHYQCAEDGVLYTQPFRVKRETRVRIYALGEANWRGHLLADYAWIQRATCGELIWSMDMKNTEPAGGAAKNRRFDGEIYLTPGYYFAHYLTDSSHSCQSWNAAPPYDPLSWGVSILPGKGFSRGDLYKVKMDAVPVDPAILVKMIMVRDGEHRREKFTLDVPTRVEIQALGEGSKGEMWDLGWIVNSEQRKTVWKMTWRDSRPAGGAEKNRKFRGVIQLQPGRYVAHYESDDSHSFGEWNALPPNQPHLWGMTVRVAD